MLRSALAAGGLLGTGAAPSFAATPPETRPQGASRAGSAASISRQFARWVAGLRFEDLPPEVVDRAKGLTRISHNLCDDDGFGGARGVDAGRVPVR